MGRPDRGKPGKRQTGKPVLAGRGTNRTDGSFPSPWSSIWGSVLVGDLWICQGDRWIGLWRARIARRVCSELALSIDFTEVARRASSLSGATVFQRAFYLAATGFVTVDGAGAGRVGLAVDRAQTGAAVDAAGAGIVRVAIDRTLVGFAAQSAGARIVGPAGNVAGIGGITSDIVDTRVVDHAIDGALSGHFIAAQVNTRTAGCTFKVAPVLWRANIALTCVSLIAREDTSAIGHALSPCVRAERFHTHALVGAAIR